MSYIGLFLLSNIVIGYSDSQLYHYCVITEHVYTIVKPTIFDLVRQPLNTCILVPIYHIPTTLSILYECSLYRCSRMPT